jgi:hypothetical protein
MTYQCQVNSRNTLKGPFVVTKSSQLLILSRENVMIATVQMNAFRKYDTDEIKFKVKSISYKLPSGFVTG